MTPTETQRQYAERKIERRLNEHTQMAVMLERSAVSCWALAELGGLNEMQQNGLAALRRDIEALLRKVNS